MPERPLTIATYAAGASLAAAALVYVFGPTFFLDDDAAQSSRASRKKGVVGLANPANDCFMNSILQALAGLADLRIYLIREVHRRALDGPEMYAAASLKEARGDRQWAADTARYGRGGMEKKEGSDEADELLSGLQQGIVTAALKDILDRLNERPIYRKTITADVFIRVLEHAFRSRISRQQQDAQEFLQVVAERLCEEYHAGLKVRRAALGVNSADEVRINGIEGQHEEETSRKRRSTPIETTTEIAGSGQEQRTSGDSDGNQEQANGSHEEPGEEGFPFEGKLESQIECLTCHFKPKPTISTFVTLTLHVPQTSSTTLNSCFDGLFKVEHIDDFKCDNCRLEHALRLKQTELSTTTSLTKRQLLSSHISKIQHALHTDPETPPKDAHLPPLSQAPRRRIARHTGIARFPRVLAVHLSRSIFCSSTASTKNLARVTFPETLPLGGLLHRTAYSLRALVTHKGGHNSGHYESFRRQPVPALFSTPHSFGTGGAYSASPRPSGAGTPSPAPSPLLEGRPASGSSASTALGLGLGLDRLRGTPAPTAEPSSSLDLPSAAPPTTLSSRGPSRAGSHASLYPPDRDTLSPTSAARTPGRPRSSTSLPGARTGSTSAGMPSSPSIPGPSASPSSAQPQPRASSSSSLVDAARERVRGRGRGRKAAAGVAGGMTDRWWRISDEKIKESRTAEVLGMQKEVYLLFYERVDDGVGGGGGGDGEG